MITQRDVRADRQNFRRVLAVPERDARRVPEVSPQERCAVRARSWNPVARGAGPFYFPDGKARFKPDPLRRSGRGCRRALSNHPHDRRVVSHSCRAIDAPHRPARRPLPGAARRESTALATRLGISDGDCTFGRSRGAARSSFRRQDHPTRHRVHIVPLGRRKSANQLTIAGSDPISKIPGTSVLRRTRAEAAGHPEYATLLEPNSKESHDASARHVRIFVDPARCIAVSRASRLWRSVTPTRGPS